MPIPAVNYVFNPQLQILRDWVVDPSTGGFDTASARVDFYGAATAFRAAYAPGSKAPAEAGQEMYLAGAQIEDQSGGWITATLFAKGFATTTNAGGAGDGGAGKLSSVEFQSFEGAEKLWPYTEGSITYYLDGQRAGQNTKLNPFNVVGGNAQPFRIREIFQRATLNRITYQIGGSSSPPPKPSAGRPQGLPQQVQSVSQTNPNPLLSTVTGWIRTAPVSPQVEKLGPLIFRTWQESFQWVDRIVIE